MRRTIIRIAVLFLLTVHFSLLTVFAQVPQAFNYQAVARDGLGKLIATQAIGVKIIIHKDSSLGSVVYSETFAPTTNQFGLFTVAVGKGAIVAGVFNSITWNTGDYWLQVKMDPAGGSAYADMGASQLLSVPYAMYAANGGISGATGPTGISGINGATGATGQAGINGATGTTGQAGINGATGTTGADGVTGPSGPSGIDGATGPTGQAGIDGATGAIGTTGTAGIDGATGSVGPTGTAGIDGATGLVGPTGSAATVREVTDEFNAAASQTSFTLTQSPSAFSKVKMYVNGVRISNTAYSNTGTTLTYVPASNGSYTLTVGDRIQFDYYY
jgi:hypothetical protein